MLIYQVAIIFYPGVYLREPTQRGTSLTSHICQAPRRLADRYLAAADLFDIGTQGFRLLQEFLEVA